MSGSIKRIDARGLACPQPVVLTKKALEEGGFDILEVTVDGPTAKENVSRYAAHSGHEAEAIDGEGGSATIKIRPRAPSREASTSSEATTLFISSDKIGSGDEELGALLMRGFIKTLIEATSLPARIILMNSGVRLAVEGSPVLESLSALAARGVEILACGTCLDFYKLKERLAAGRVSNMFEISGFLLEGRTLSL